MHYTIRQLSATQWALVDEDDNVVATFDDAPGRTGYELAVLALGGIITGTLPDDERNALALGDVGLLPEWWTSDEGIAFSIATPGGRDFTNCVWSWRDPTACLLPVMFQTKNLPAHMEADLAGFIVDFTGGGIGTVGARGRFYDSESGRAARDTVAAGGRFGVSVDPTENYEVKEHFECIATDEDGDCVDGVFTMEFLSYEIGGFTIEPHPCFEQASIVIGQDPSIATTAPRPIAASGGIRVPDAPPREWMELAEPAPGQPFLNWTDGSDVLVEQFDRAGNVVGHATPIILRDDALVYGHLTYWGQCHVADPWGPGVCASASPSKTGYRDFHTGLTRCADGSDVATGVLTVGCEHSAAFDVAGVQDHLAHAGLGWADVRVVDGVYGPWLSGVLKKDVTDDQVRLLRSLSLSGEWVGELAGILSVNTPGLPIQRALAASAYPRLVGPGQPRFEIPDARMQSDVLRSSAGVHVSKLVGGNIVRRCPECEQRRLAATGGITMEAMASRIDEIGRTLRDIESRTRHLVPIEAQRLAAGLAG